MKRVRISRASIALVLAVIVLLLTAWPVFGHDQPDGADWLMADWMLYSWMAFGGAGMFMFLVAFRRGYLSHLEETKYHILSIDEPDYYTPDWARDDAEDEEAGTDAKRK